MRISETTFSKVDVEFMKSYLRIDEDFSDDDNEIQVFLDVSRAWIMEHAEMTEEELDEINFATILLLRFTADFYNDRTARYSNKFSIDPVTDMLLTKIRSYNLGSIPVVEEKPPIKEPPIEENPPTEENPPEEDIPPTEENPPTEEEGEQVNG